MIICENYFKDEIDNDDIINDIESKNNYNHTVDSNYEFDIYLNEVDSLSKFNMLLSALFDSTYNISDYLITYRNFTMCNCEVVDNREIPNCDYFGVSGTDEDGEEIWDDFENPCDSKERDFSTEYINDIPVRIHNSKYYEDGILYAHIRLDMRKFRTTNQFKNFISAIYKICSRRLKKFEQSVHYIASFGKVDNRHTCDIADIAIMCGKEKPYQRDVLERLSICESITLCKAFCENIYIFNYCESNGYSMPEMIIEMNNIPCIKKLLGVCNGSEVTTPYKTSDGSFSNNIKNDLYIATSWTNLDSNICTYIKKEVQEYLEVIKLENIKAYIYGSSYDDIFYAFFNKPLEFGNINGCRYLYMIINFNPLENDEKNTTI